MKNRLPDPPEICALEFKGEFRQFGICTVSVTIGTDRLNFLTPRSRPQASSSAQKGPSPHDRVRADGAGWFLDYPGHRRITPKLRAFIDHDIGLLTK
jgi:hypothetical protein